MTDLRAGRIQAYLDREMDDAELQAFVEDMEDDAELRSAVSAQRQRNDRVLEAMGRLAVQPPDLQAVKERVLERAGLVGDEGLERVEGHGNDRRGARWFSTPAIRAAAVVLLAVGAVSAAVPGSPLRRWLGPGLATGEDPVLITPRVEAASANNAGVRVAPAGDRLDIVLVDALDGGELRVSLVDSDMAEVLTSPGARFSTAEGSVRVQGASGDVTVHIPRRADRVTVRVAGELYLRKTGERMEVFRSGVDTTLSELIFTPPGTPPQP